MMYVIKLLAEVKLYHVFSRIYILHLRKGIIIEYINENVSRKVWNNSLISFGIKNFSLSLLVVHYSKILFKCIKNIKTLFLSGKI